MKKMGFHRLELCAAIAILLLFTYAAAAGAQQRAIADQVLRLHVVANSDQTEDQRVKLCVRDAVLAYCNPLLAQAQNQQQVRAILRAHMQQIADCAKAELRRQGSSVAVTAQLREEFYPTRVYTDFSLPAGRYVGLRILLGEAKGHNWWCVIFPPLCTGSATSETDTLTPDEHAFLQQDGTRYVVRFKTAELLDTLRERLGAG